MDKTIAELTNEELEAERDRNLDIALKKYPNGGPKFWAPIEELELEMSRRGMKLGI